MSSLGYNVNDGFPSDPFKRAPRGRYDLIDGLTGALVCAYKAKSIALRDCERRNAPLLPDRRYFVRKPNGGRVTA